MASAALFLLAAALVTEVYAQDYIVPPAPTAPTNYQKWAHLHWVWLHNSEGNQQNITDLVQGYTDNQIPVGAVNIDSEWATEFNNFEVRTDKFPDFPALIADLHSQQIRVTMWVTSMVNVENPDYKMCVDNQFLLRNSRGFVRPLQWWHGYGGLLDYSNPDAVDWWHAQMDKVLDVGIDGFKCDGTDPYILEYSLTGGALGYNDKVITYRDYADMYYRDFFYHTRDKRSLTTAAAAESSTGSSPISSRRLRGTDSSATTATTAATAATTTAATVYSGDAGLIMSRPVDCLIDPVSKLCIPSSPHDVMYSGWVGDDDATFNGLRGCLRKVIYSAWTGYANFACDVGGYRGDKETKDQTNFLRSAQLNSFLPLMENGGGGEHRPWMYDTATTTTATTATTVVVPIYRKFVVQHHRLSAYLLTNGADAMDNKRSAIFPLDVESIPAIKQQQREAVDTSGSRSSEFNNTISSKYYRTDISIVFPQPTTYAYLLGTDLLIHPVLYDAANGTEAAIVEIEFPQLSDVVINSSGRKGSSEPTQWMDWWQPSNQRHLHSAGNKITRVVPLESYPVYVRRGALMPLHPLVQPVNAATTTSTTAAVTTTTTVATSASTTTTAAIVRTPDDNDDTAVDVDLNRVIFTWFGPSTATAETSSATYALRESITQGNGMTATMQFTDESTIVAEVSAHTVAAVQSDGTTDSSAGTRSLGAGISIVGIKEPLNVLVESWTAEDAPAQCEDPRYDSSRQQLTVSCADNSRGLRVTITGVVSSLK